MRAFGSIQERGPRSFRVRYSLADGTRRQESYKTRELAEAALSQRIVSPESSSNYKPLTRRVFRRLKSVGEVSGVYFVWNKETGLTKIGHSAKAGRRIADITSNSGANLYLIGFLPTLAHLEAERAMHAFLVRQRIRGEWFRLCESDIEAAIAHWLCPRFRKEGE